MRTIRKLFILEKRLFRRKIFIIAMALLPLMIIALRTTAGDGTGVCHIVYYMPDESDSYLQSVEKKFSGYADIIDYRKVSSEETARQMVTDKKADAAWIFAKNPEDIIRRAAMKGRVRPVVRIYQRRSNVMLMLAREILDDSFFPEEAYHAYTGFIRNDLGITRDMVPDKELESVFNGHVMSGSMFEMYFPDGSVDENYSYLMAPVRGIMAVWLLACAFIAVMLAAVDEKNGVYSRIPLTRRPLERLLSETVLMVTAMVVFVIALCAAGVFTRVETEIPCLILYAVSVLGFADLIGQMSCDNTVIMCTVMVMSLLCAVVLSPVFVSVGIPGISRFVSADSYLRGIHSPMYIARLAIYDAVVILCTFCVRTVKKLLH